MQKRGAFLDWITHRRGVRRWRRNARLAPDMSHAMLRQERAKARNLMNSLGEFTMIADSRLALPMIGSDAFAKPHGTDWAWRPPLWREPLMIPGISSVQSKSKLGEDVTVFHDCTHSELTLRQVRNQRAADLAPFGLRIDVFNFDGSYLSLALNLPDAAVAGLRKRHLIRMEMIAEMEKPVKFFARLNIKHGPNTVQIVRELELQGAEDAVEFDLAYGDLNEDRVERAWIDLIIDDPAMCQVILRDLTLSRRLRAEL